MVDLKSFKKNKIRKVLEFENEIGEMERVEIYNPSREVRNKFNEELESEEAKEDNYYMIEWLIKHCTNIELTIPLKELDEEDYVTYVLAEVIKEISTIFYELIVELCMSIESHTGIVDSYVMVDKLKKEDEE